MGFTATLYLDSNERLHYYMITWWVDHDDHPPLEDMLIQSSIFFFNEWYFTCMSDATTEVRMEQIFSRLEREGGWGRLSRKENDLRNECCLFMMCARLVLSRSRRALKARGKR